MARINTDGTIDIGHRVPGDRIADTAWHHDTILASVNQLRAIFGEPDHSDPDCPDKVSVEWRIDTPQGVFAIYDWKQYDHPALSSPDTPYRLHIGEHKKGTGLTALATAAAFAEPAPLFRDLLELIQ
jgi:hypothetical protein